MRKSYTVTVDDKAPDGKSHMRRVNDGFSALELMGLAAMLQFEIMEQMNGTITPDAVERVVVKDAGRRECKDCEELPDNGSCDKCGDTILTTKDMFVRKGCATQPKATQ